MKKLLVSMRPYDGALWAPLKQNQDSQFPPIHAMAKRKELHVSQNKNSIVLAYRHGLAGSADWTHQYGNIANTIKSDDKLVKMPLGLLWFGGNSHEDVLPRHGHGPPEQIVDGRLVIEGINCISARDIYTGRVLWKTLLDSLETFRIYYNETYANTPLIASYNQRHIPGANGRGTNFIATKDFVYIIQQGNCDVLDITTGVKTTTFSLPLLDNGQKADWTYIGVYENSLIAGSKFAQYSVLVPATPKELDDLAKLMPPRQLDNRDKENYDLTASQFIVVLDRYSGEAKWKMSARYDFIHNSIIAAKGKIFCLDKLPAFIENKMERRGITPPEDDYRLLVIDIASGEILWETNKNVFGSWLSYSAEHDVLLQADRPSNDMLRGEEGKRMIVYQAADMTELWDKEIEYDNPPILHRDRIIVEHFAYNLISGEQIQRSDPLTHEIIPWSYIGTKGCNYSIACENMLSFRSSAAAFFDLRDNGGTGHFGGFRSGCTSNLIAAGGILNAPDYTRTCQYSFQNQTSLALVYMPGVEYWTESDFKWSGKRIKQVGINLNAPGDRTAENGTVWLDYPSVGGPSPDLPIKIETHNPKYLRRFSWLLHGENDLPWVAASGITGISNIEITLLSTGEISDPNYTVHLYFAELENKGFGERVFDINVQDQQYIKNFDIAKEAGQANHCVVKSFENIKIEKELNLTFEPSNQAPQSAPLVCGIEILIEK